MENNGLPPGFELDAPKAASELPPGFQLDSQPLPEGFELDSTSSASEPHPILAATEGAMRGLTAGISDAVFKGARKLAEAVTDNPDYQNMIAPKIEDVSSRSESTPAKVGEAAGVIGGMLTGTGAPGAISKGAKAVIPEARGALAKVGSAMLRGTAEGALLQSGDELSKAMLGKGDPEEAVSSALARMGGAGLIGGFTGGVFSGVGQGASKGLAALENAKMGTKAENILAGMALASRAKEAGVPPDKVEEYATKYFKDFSADEMFNYNHYRDGVNLYNKAHSKIIRTAVNTAAGAGAAALGGDDESLKERALAGAAAGFLSDKYIVPMVEKVLQKPLLRANKYVAPTMMYALEKGQTSGLFNLLNHTNEIARGAKAVNSGVESVFRGGAQQGINDLVSDRDIKSIKKYLDDGGVTQEMQDSLKESPEADQNFAKGGKVQTQPDHSGSIANMYPEQAMMMSEAKGRMSNYLNSLKPQKNTPKLPYDKPMDQKSQNRTYDEAVHMAAAPLSVLKHIKDGTLQIRHLKHMNGMYPELTKHLQKKLTARLMQSQLEGDHPKGATKQALAMFLGAALETYQTPQGIMAAQSTFAKSQPQQQQDGTMKGKQGKAAINKLPGSYKTPGQAAESDRANRD